jgi:hypothetical protein
VRTVAITAALLVVLLGAGASPAAAKTPCWKKVIQDWYDNGRLDGNYSPSCLSEARKHLPEDVRTYGSFDDVLQRERQQAVRRLASTRPPASTSREPQAEREPEAAEPTRGLFKKAFDKTSPRSADSLPLPLLFLAGLALLLITAGATGLVSRRVRARRVPTPPTP